MNKVFKYLGCWLAITLAFGTWMWIDDDIERFLWWKHYMYTGILFAVLVYIFGSLEAFASVGWMSRQVHCLTEHIKCQNRLQTHMQSYSKANEQLAMDMIAKLKKIRVAEKSMKVEIEALGHKLKEQT